MSGMLVRVASYGSPLLLVGIMLEWDSYDYL